MKTIKADICVIGGGSGGLSVAAGAQQMGAQVVLCEGSKMGGDCLNYGCVPSKALIEASRIMYMQKKSSDFGITLDAKVDFKAIHNHVKSVIKSIEPHDSVERFESLGVTVVKHYASFIDKNTLKAGDTFIKAKYIVIAPGSRARIIPIEGLSDINYLTNETIFNLQELPEHLLVVGGGPIGLELAEAFSLLGSKVTIIESSDKLLGMINNDCRQIILDQLSNLGINIIEGAEVIKFAKSATSNILEYKIAEEAYTLDFSHMLLAVGRIPNLEKLNLDNAKIQYTQKGIQTDERLRTNHKHIYAMGDVAGPYQFTHAASYHSSVIIKNMLFKIPAKVNYTGFPWAIYTTPEIAHTGLDLAQAQTQGAKILTMNYKNNDRATASLATEGILKVAVQPNGRVLGATIVGDHAGELISNWAFLTQHKIKIKALAETIVPYPTLSEMNKHIAGTFFSPTLYSAKMKRLVRFLLRWI